MFRRIGLLTCVASLALALSATAANAAWVRYHYVPPPPGTTSYYQLAGTGGAAGERLSWYSGRWEPYDCPPRPTCQVTFRHPCTGALIRVPLCLPDSIPRMEYRYNTTIYNYGSDTVQVHFLPDGSADVIYTSGLFRAP